MQATKVFIAALLAAASLAARSEQEREPPQRPSVPLLSTTQAADLPDAQAIAGRTFSPEQAGNLRAARMALALSVWQSRDNTSCFASVGPTSVPSAGKVVRRPEAFHWAMSEARQGEQAVASCHRALEAAMQSLTKSDVLNSQNLEAAASATRDPSTPKFPKVARSPGVVSHRTAGTLNDAGKQLIADTLGARWHQVLDHRKFAAHVVLMTGKTLEGKPFCLVEYGLVATPPEGVTWKFPGSTGARWRVAEDKNSSEDCTRPVVRSALENLRDTYPQMLDDFDAEAGMAYPSAAELRKQIARFDAEQAKPRRASTASTTRATTSPRCTNECFNGNCVRTFENGRKERWQAPRVYNAFKQNWEWDTTTNACGG